MKLPIPQDLLDEVFGLVKDQAEEKQKESK